MNEARETFGQKSGEYALARPRYPESLFHWLASMCVRHDFAWDCATGNGQAAAGLSPLFGTVYATDLSAEQIANALPAENVRYSVQQAERTLLAAHCANLITVAQALHWFDFPKFWAEVRRVASGDALFAAWGYDWLYVSAGIDAGVIDPFRAIVYPFWAPNNRMLWNGYRDADIQFPFQRMEAPPFSLAVEWTLDQILGYMRTWSAYKRSLADPHAAAAMDELVKRTKGMAPVDEVFQVRMPLKMVVGRVTPGATR